MPNQYVATDSSTGLEVTVTGNFPEDPDDRVRIARTSTLFTRLMATILAMEDATPRREGFRAVETQLEIADALLRREMFKLMESVDVLVSPTTSGPAPPIEATQTRITTVGEVVRGVFAVRNNSTTFNMSGLPAVSVPCGFSSDGLPLGLQFSGRMHQDETIFQAAHAYEQANDWGRRRPAVVSG